MTDWATDIKHAMTAAYHLGFAHGWEAGEGKRSIVDGWQDRDDQLDSLVAAWRRAFTGAPS